MSELDPSIRQVAEAVRTVLLEVEPALRESVKWSNPVYEKRGKLFYIAATEKYVSLGFFNGAELTDPDSRIAGTGRRMRHLKIRALEDIDQGQLRTWVAEAVVLDERDPQ
jgi:hypothetical protein